MVQYQCVFHDRCGPHRHFSFHFAKSYLRSVPVVRLRRNTIKHWIEAVATISTTCLCPGPGVYAGPGFCHSVTLCRSR